MTRRVFVTGTDTGVGKTIVTCAIARALRAAGRDVGVMKPCETGVDAAGPLDAMALREAAGVDDPLELICPQQFALPAAPSVAAAAEDREVDLDAIDAAARELDARHEMLLVEGAGGLRVPIVETRERRGGESEGGFNMADLAIRLGASDLIVVARAALGTINHTLLTLDAARRGGFGRLGVVISHGTEAISNADAQNLDALRRALGDSLLAEVPPRADTDRLRLELPWAL